MITAKLFNIAGFLVQAAKPTQQQVDAFKKLSPFEKIILIFKQDADLFNVLVGIILLFLAAVFIMLFIKRWNISRMGYFLVTVCAFGVRVQNPSDKFWTVFSLAAAVFSFVMFFLTQKNVDYDSKKEPLYFLFNAFAALCIAFPMGKPVDFIMGSIGMIALISSLFFVVTNKPTAKGDMRKNTADQAIINVLEKKKNRSI